jgi:hypothetical protein
VLDTGTARVSSDEGVQCRSAGERFGFPDQFAWHRSCSVTRRMSALHSPFVSPVELVSARAFPTLDVEVPSSFALRFPEGWWSSPSCHPQADAIARDTITWLRTFGMGCDTVEATEVGKFDCAKYGGYSLPVADRARATLVTEFFALWLFWDDMQVEEEQGWDIEEVVRALTSRNAPSTTSRYVAAWSDLGRRFCLTQSDAWLEGLATTMRQWLENAKIETGMAKAYRHGHCSDFATALDIRTVSVGMSPTIRLLEYAGGMELPDFVHEHPVVMELERVGGRLVGLGNDLGGLAKDIDQRWLNVVLILHEGSALPLEDAFQHVVTIHNADVQTFDHLCSQLPSWGSHIDRLVAVWLRMIRHSIQGFARWAAEAERYQQRKAVVNGKALVAPLISIGEERRGPRTATAGTMASPRPTGTAS